MSIEGLIMLVIYIIVIGVVCYLLIYLIDAIPIGEPFNRVARTVILVVGVLLVILLLLQFVGVGGHLALK